MEAAQVEVFDLIDLAVALVFAGYLSPPFVIAHHLLMPGAHSLGRYFLTYLTSIRSKLRNFESYDIISAFELLRG